MALRVLPVHAQLYSKTIQTMYGPVMGFKYFNESTLETFWNLSSSNVAAFLGIPYAADTGYEVFSFATTGGLFLIFQYRIAGKPPNRVNHGIRLCWQHPLDPNVQQITPPVIAKIA